MSFNTNKIDEANATISGIISVDTIEANLDKVAKQAAKTMDIQGFRKGKVPIKLIKQRYADKLKQDAQDESVREVLNKGLKELDIDNKELIGNPNFAKFDEKDDGSIEYEITINTVPKFDLGDYKSLIPQLNLPTVTDEEVEEKIKNMAAQDVPLKTIEAKRAAQSGDFVVIDFKGFKDGEPFEGGEAKGYTLELGSGSFIPGFEDQIVGMECGEEKDIEVTFPKNYQAKDLAGAPVVFKVKLHELKEKGEVEINDEFAKKMLPTKEDANLDMLKEEIKKDIEAEKKLNYFMDEVKPSYIQKLVESIEFAVPSNILEQELNQLLNNKAKDMSNEEIEKLRENQDEVKKMLEELRPEAIDNVKATFIVDALAKAEGVEVSDQEVTQTLYYEALMKGQDGKALIEQYGKAGYMPMIKISMTESRVMMKLFEEKLGN